MHRSALGVLLLLATLAAARPHEPLDKLMDKWAGKLTDHAGKWAGKLTDWAHSLDPGSPRQLLRLPVRELKRRLDQLAVGYVGMIEKRELVDALCAATPSCGSNELAETVDRLEAGAAASALELERLSRQNRVLGEKLDQLGVQDSTGRARECLQNGPNAWCEASQLCREVDSLASEKPEACSGVVGWAGRGLRRGQGWQVRVNKLPPASCLTGKTDRGRQDPPTGAGLARPEGAEEELGRRADDGATDANTADDHGTTSADTDDDECWIAMLAVGLAGLVAAAGCSSARREAAPVPAQAPAASPAAMAVPVPAAAVVSPSGPQTGADLDKDDQEPALAAKILPAAGFDTVQLRELEQMGFTDCEANARALQQSGGSFTATIRMLVAAERQSSSVDSGDSGM